MPQMANITVKKADGTTDVVYSALTPSSGDKTAAQWRCETVGASASLRPIFQMASTYNGTRTARRLDLTFKFPWPVIDANTGIATVKATLPASIQITVPTNVPDATVAEAIAQFANLLKSTLVQDSLKSGYAPT